MAIRFGSGISIGLGSKVAMDPIYFPTDSIVPYYGAAPTLSDWDVYTAANGYNIMGTTTSGAAGTTATGTAPITLTSLGTTGAHTGTVTYRTGGSTTTVGTTAPNNNNSSAGNHAHSGGATFSNIRAQSSLVTLLKANKNTRILPPGAIAFRNAAVGSYGNRFKPVTNQNNTNYFQGSLSGGTTPTPVNSQVVSINSSTSGAHVHHTNTRNPLVGSGNGLLVSSGNHTHPLEVTLTQSILNNTAILHAWQTATEMVPETDVVIMYVGNLANLPTFWKLCDGNNGTINMHNYYAAFDPTNDNISWYTIRNNNASASSTIFATLNATHSHSSGSTAYGAGYTGYHGNQAWDHNHTLTTSISTQYSLPRIFLHFIQYKG